MVLACYRGRAAINTPADVCSVWLHRVSQSKQVTDFLMQSVFLAGKGVKSVLDRREEGGGRREEGGGRREEGGGRREEGGGRREPRGGSRMQGEALDRGRGASHRCLIVQLSIELSGCFPDKQNFVQNLSCYLYFLVCQY
jgi:hypothetical protein